MRRLWATRQASTRGGLHLVPFARGESHYWRMDCTHQSRRRPLSLGFHPQILGLMGGRRMDLTRSVYNEWLCAQLLPEFGLPVATTDIGTFDARAYRADVPGRPESAHRCADVPPEVAGSTNSNPKRPPG